ncbi:MAG: hypothetical protein WDW36_009153 [Sanguina aurantia]
MHRHGTWWKAIFAAVQPVLSASSLAVQLISQPVLSQRALLQASAAAIPIYPPLTGGKRDTWQVLPSPASLPAAQAPQRIHAFIQTPTAPDSRPIPPSGQGPISIFAPAGGNAVPGQPPRAAYQPSMPQPQQQPSSGTPAKGSSSFPQLASSRSHPRFPHAPASSPAPATRAGPAAKQSPTANPSHPFANLSPQLPPRAFPTRATNHAAAGLVNTPQPLRHPTSKMPGARSIFPLSSSPAQPQPLLPSIPATHAGSPSRQAAEPRPGSSSAPAASRQHPHTAPHRRSTVAAAAAADAADGVSSPDGSAPPQHRPHTTTHTQPPAKRRKRQLPDAPTSSLSGTHSSTSPGSSSSAPPHPPPAARHPARPSAVAHTDGASAPPSPTPPRRPGGGRRDGRRLDPREISLRIKSATHVEQLDSLLSTNLSQLNGINVCAAIVKLYKLAAAWHDTYTDAPTLASADATPAGAPAPAAAAPQPVVGAAPGSGVAAPTPAASQPQSGDGGGSGSSRPGPQTSAAATWAGRRRAEGRLGRGSVYSSAYGKRASSSSSSDTISSSGSSGGSSGSGAGPAGDQPPPAAAPAAAPHPAASTTVALLSSMGALLVEKRGELSGGRQLANVAWAMGLPDAHRLPDVLELVLRHELSNLAWGLASLGLRAAQPPPAPHHAQPQAQGQPQPPVQPAGGFFASARSTYAAATASLSGQQQQQQQQHSQQQHSSSSSSASPPSSDAADRGVQAAAGPPGSSPRGGGGGGGGSGRAADDRAEVWGNISRAACRVLPQFKGRELSSLLWSMATAGHSDRILLRAAAIRATASLEQFSSRDLSTLLWALARLGLRHPPLLEAAALRLASSAARAERAGHRQHPLVLRAPGLLAQGAAVRGRLGRHAPALHWSQQPPPAPAPAPRPPARWRGATCGVHSSKPTSLSEAQPRAGPPAAAPSDTPSSQGPSPSPQPSAHTHADPAPVVDLLPPPRRPPQPPPLSQPPPSGPGRPLPPQQPRLALHAFPSQELCNVLWAAATLRHWQPEFTLHLSRTLAQRAPSLSGRALANTLWALARLSTLPDPELDQQHHPAAPDQQHHPAAPDPQQQQQQHSATPDQHHPAAPDPQQQQQQHSATPDQQQQQHPATPDQQQQQRDPQQQLSQHSMSLSQRLATTTLITAALGQLHTMRPPEVANTLWACAQLAAHHTEVFVSLEGGRSGRDGGGAAGGGGGSLHESLDELSRAMSVGGARHNQVVDQDLLRAAVARLGPQQVEACEPRELNQLMLAEGRLQCLGGETMDGLTAQILLRLPNFSARDLATLAFGLAKQRRFDSLLFSQIAEAIVPLVPALDPQESVPDPLTPSPPALTPLHTTHTGLTTVGWAFASAQLYHGPLTSAIRAAALPLLPQFSLLELSNLLWSLAIIRLRDQPLMAAAARLLLGAAAASSSRSLPSREPTTAAAATTTTTSAAAAASQQQQQQQGLPPLDAEGGSPSQQQQASSSGSSSGSRSKASGTATAALATCTATPSAAAAAAAAATRKPSRPSSTPHAQAAAHPVKLLSRPFASASYDELSSSGDEDDGWSEVWPGTSSSSRGVDAGNRNPGRFRGHPLTPGFSQLGSSSNIGGAKSAARSYCKLLWSFAKSGYYERRLFELLALLLTPGLQLLTPHELAQVLWACESQDHSCRKFLQAAALAVEDKLDAFSATDAVSVAAAYAKLQFPSPQLFRQLLLHTQVHESGYDLRRFEGMAAAFASLDMPGRYVVQQRVGELQQQQRQHARSVDFEGRGGQRVGHGIHGGG